MQLMKAFYKIKGDGKSARLFDIMLKEPNIPPKRPKVYKRSYICSGRE